MHPLIAVQCYPVVHSLSAHPLIAVSRCPAAFPAALPDCCAVLHFSVHCIAVLCCRAVSESALPTYGAGTCYAAAHSTLPDCRAVLCPAVPCRALLCRAVQMGPSDVTAALLVARDPGPEDPPIERARVALLGDPFSYQHHRVNVSVAWKACFEVYGLGLQSESLCRCVLALSRWAYTDVV
jgi:hypothetical protein